MGIFPGERFRLSDARSSLTLRYRFKKYGQFTSLLFPQFKENPVTNLHIKLPKIGAIPTKKHRPIPPGFTVKQVRIIRKADIWYASVNIQCDVSVPDPMPHGHPIGVDTGLEKFLATSDGYLVKPPKFFKSLQSKLLALAGARLRATIAATQAFKEKEAVIQLRETTH